MAQKLVLAFSVSGLKLQDITQFVDRCEEQKFGPRTPVNFELKDDKYMFSILIPEPVKKVRKVRKVAETVVVDTPKVEEKPVVKTTAKKTSTRVRKPKVS